MTNKKRQGRRRIVQREPVKCEARHDDYQYRIDLPSGMYRHIRDFLFTGPRQERFGVMLAGVSRMGENVRLLGREFVPATGAAVVRASLGGVVASSSFSRRLMERCAETGLSQIDVHSHPFGGDNALWFSSIDDRAEAEVATYIYRHLPNTLYASLVFDEAGERGRVWLKGRPARWQAMISMRLVEAPLRDMALGRGSGRQHHQLRVCAPAFDRQIRAFGGEGQAKLRQATITVVGAGGVGSVVIEGAARLGFGAINIVEPDKAEVSNLNRVVGMRYDDAVRGTDKATIAARMVRDINPAISVESYPVSVFDESVWPVLKKSDVLVAATDSHSSRMFCERVAAQYLIPLLHLGVNIDALDGQLVDVSGEYAVMLPGPAGWCLSCARAIDPQQAAWELASPLDQARWVQRGYVRGADVPAPSVRHLNGVVADLLLAELHNLFSPYRESRPYVVYDGLRCEVTPVSIGRDPRCAICSEHGVLGLGDLEPLPTFNHPRPMALPDAPPQAIKERGLPMDGGEGEEQPIAGYLEYAQHKRA